MIKKYCKAQEDEDQDNCTKWRAAEKLKCNAFGECKVDLFASKMQCQGAFQAMAYSFLTEAANIPSELTYNSVGDCYENTIVSFKTCVDEVKPAIDESFMGVSVPSKEELKAFRKAQKSKRKNKRRNKRKQQ